MTDYNPPTEDLPIFDKLVFLSGEEYITQNQADKRYLRYPNAQGTENLQAINVNGTATLNGLSYVNKNLTMNATNALDRQINTGYLNLIPITGGPVATGTTLYQNTNVVYIDNNVNDGALAMAFNTPGGVQKITNTHTWATSQFTVPVLINNIGNYLQFPDGTQQTTAFTGATNKTYSVEYTSTQTITIPANCVGISVCLVGQGGQAGFNANTGVGTTWNSGGSGGGASMILSQTMIPITSGSLSLTISNTSGNPNFLTYNGIEICRAYNGYNGGNATVGAGGIAGIAQTQGLGNTSISTWFIVSGSVGTVGNANITFQNCAGVPTTAGKPNNILTTGTGNDTVKGCGQRYFAIGATNQCPTSTPLPTGCLTVTYYLK